MAGWPQALHGLLDHGWMAMKGFSSIASSGSTQEGKTPIGLGSDVILRT
jgi:hypothetical protein